MKFVLLLNEKRYFVAVSYLWRQLSRVRNQLTLESFLENTTPVIEAVEDPKLTIKLDRVPTNSSSRYDTLGVCLHSTLFGYFDRRFLTDPYFSNNNFCFFKKKKPLVTFTLLFSNLKNSFADTFSWWCRFGDVRRM